MAGRVSWQASLQSCSSREKPDLRPTAFNEHRGQPKSAMTRLSRRHPIRRKAVVPTPLADGSLSGIRARNGCALSSVAGCAGHQPAIEPACVPVDTVAKQRPITPSHRMISELDHRVLVIVFDDGDLGILKMG